MNKFREEKIGGQLVPTFAADLSGGGSREWDRIRVAMMRLFELYELWQETTGERLADLSPHARDSLVHMMHTIVPTLDRVAPVGDHSRDSTGALFDYHRNYLQLLIRLFHDEPVAGNAQWLLAHSSVTRMNQRFMFVYDFLYHSTDVAERPLSELNTAYYARGTGQLYLRSSWANDATWVHLIAGPYTESHAHQDQGSLMFYGGGWLAYDANVGTISGIRQEVAMHNLVRIDQNGSSASMRLHENAGQLFALRDTPAFAYAGCDVSQGYGGSSGVNRLEREMVFAKPDLLVVFDRVETAAAANHVWQINSPSPFNGVNSGFVSGVLHVRGVHPTDTVSRSQAWNSIDSDIASGYRLELARNDASSSRFLTLLSRGQLAATTPRSTADSLGVQIGLSTGESIVVDFNRDTRGGHYERYSAVGDLIEAVDLNEGVQDLSVSAP
ncbi:MAG: heparinase II/III family protein [Polyangiaceae bacterium]